MIIIPQYIRNKLPKTGQNTSYLAGDDGDIENGFSGERFQEVQINGINLVKDHATGVMWPKNLNQFSGTTQHLWTNAINIINTSNLADFIDWRLPNIFEYISIVDFAVGNFYSVFTCSANPMYWTSTTFGGYTSYAFVFEMNGYYADDKTFYSYNYCGCRNF